MSSMIEEFFKGWNAAVSMVAIIFAAWIIGTVSSAMWDSVKEVTPQTPEAQNAINAAETADMLQGVTEDADKIRGKILTIITAASVIAGPTIGAFWKTGNGRLLLFLLIIPFLLLL